MIDWPEIVRRDGPAVWRTVYRLLGNRADADDCFQETFLAAVTLFRREPVQNPQALLQRLATSRAIDRLRRRYRQAPREDSLAGSDELPAPGLQPPDAAESAELSERIRDALSVLPAKQAMAFCLFYLDGWNYAQIATHLRASVNAVGVLLHRARHRLQELLTGYALPQRFTSGK